MIASFIKVARAWSRMARLAFEIVLALTRYRSAAKSVWLHQTCIRMLRVFDIRVTATGRLPARGLVVANHLSYVDILVLAALTPCVFVAKKEVSGWPVFGAFARLAGTIFVNRELRTDTARGNGLIKQALDAGETVVLFAEGTSTGGHTVLPFRSSLLQSVIDCPAPITAVALNYEIPAGDAGEVVCYCGNHTLVPHLLRLAANSHVSASVRMEALGTAPTSRKQLAKELHEKVMQLHRLVKASPGAVQRPSAEVPDLPNVPRETEYESDLYLRAQL